MTAWVLEDGFGLEKLTRSTRPLPQPRGAEVRLRVLAASLNYRDLVVVAGRHGKAITTPLIPVSDGVGVIEALGEDVTGFSLGDRVCPMFFQGWIGGEPPLDMHACALGGPLDGMLASYRVFAAQGLVRIPDALSDVEAASLPCAGVTAWSAIAEPRAVHPGETVLVLGTGGVALFAVQFARAAGARVIVTTSNPAKAALLRRMGAHHVIDRTRTRDWAAAVLSLTDGRGCDRVVELGGAETLNHSLTAVRPGGLVTLIGNVTGSRAELFLPLVLTRRVTMNSVSVGSGQAFERMLGAMTLHEIRPVIDRVYPFAQVPAAFARLAAQEHCGKICISMSTLDGAAPGRGA
jgi:NADPH:quinone reductase-like Zn-dependent oxidoreductase